MKNLEPIVPIYREMADSDTGVMMPIEIMWQLMALGYPSFDVRDMFTIGDAEWEHFFEGVQWLRDTYPMDHVCVKDRMFFTNDEIMIQFKLMYL